VIIYKVLRNTLSVITKVLFFTDMVNCTTCCSQLGHLQVIQLREEHVGENDQHEVSGK